MSFNPLTDPQNKATIGGQRTPGVCTILGADSPRRIIKRNGVGLSGATARFAGMLLASPRIELRLHNTEDWSDWHAFRSVVQAPPLGEHARALAIEHPICADNGIRAILIENVHQPVPEGDKGVWLIVIETTEFRRPTFQLSAPDGAQDGPEDPLEITIDELSAQAQALAGVP